MILARDIMTQNPMFLTDDMKISEAVLTMLSHHISSAPIVSTHGKLLGQISEIFLLKLFILSSKKGNEQKILRDFMKSFVNPTTVLEEDPIEDVVRKIVSSPSNRALVLDISGSLKGIISPKDILRILSGEQARSGSLLNEFAVLQGRVNILKDRLSATKSQLSAMSTVIDESSFMFHSVDSKGKIVLANEKIHKDLGYNLQELLDKNMLTLYAVDSHLEAKKILERLLQGEDEVRSTLNFHKKNGETVKVDLISKRILDEKGQMIASSNFAVPIRSDELLQTLQKLQLQD